ncbi:uncharacterized protein APUU_11753S [Aspergillus puulaauensis]|uniref:Uncharacterized protein n=1 Tax=Aspergillus puulaauensis TaxID=1220207 RepID=A0A7R8AIQ8_9EURO|nr:uncharacterized protein APUU_11753S [Aspergillus puulaauensis]BCS18925.1 hypothetical protein APUU_11753S [Aspergillus puulaauensis]
MKRAGHVTHLLGPKGVTTATGSCDEGGNSSSGPPGEPPICDFSLPPCKKELSFHLLSVSAHQLPTDPATSSLV